MLMLGSMILWVVLYSVTLYCLQRGVLTRSDVAIGTTIMLVVFALRMVT